jgi:hypothetical protein
MTQRSAALINTVHAVLSEAGQLGPRERDRAEYLVDVVTETMRETNPEMLDAGAAALAHVLPGTDEDSLRTLAALVWRVMLDKA